MRPVPEAAGAVPELAMGAAPSDLSTPTLLPGVALPGELKAPNSNPNMLAELIQKQRGKPSIDTIKQMGGSDSTKGAIGATMEWLSKTRNPKAAGTRASTACRRTTTPAAPAWRCFVSTARASVTTRSASIKTTSAAPSTGRS